MWYWPCRIVIPLRWRHNGRDGVSNHQPHHCLLNRLFGRRSKKTSKFRVAGLYAGNSPVTGEFPAHMASDAENVSIWWRHHAYSTFVYVPSNTTLNPSSEGLVWDPTLVITVPADWCLSARLHLLQQWSHCSFALSHRLMPEHLTPGSRLSADTSLMMKFDLCSSKFLRFPVSPHQLWRPGDVINDGWRNFLAKILMHPPAPFLITDIVFNQEIPRPVCIPLFVYRKAVSLWVWCLCY